jgi:hypothetical protein
MGGSLKTELARAKSAPQQQSCRGTDNHQRNQLLPIHVRKITSKSPHATNDLEGVRN